MNKDEYALEAKDENITFSLIKSAINNIFNDKVKDKEINDKEINNNQIYPNNPNNINKLYFKDIEKLLNSIKKLGNIYKYIYKHNLNPYRLYKRNTRYINKLSLIKQNRIFKKPKINQYETILALFIIYLKNFINEKNHEKIKKLLLLIIRLIADKIFPLNFFTIITEIFINILIMILNLNQEYKYSLNDEPFILIKDIIESIITYPKEIKIENIDNYILTDIIDIFDKYLITPNYSNIYFRETSIWLKFLENHMINPLKENEVNNNNDNDNDNDNLIQNNNDIKENIQKKIYFFLIKIYKFNMRDEYYQNNIMKKGIIDLKYSINSLNYLIHLFNEEEKLQIDSSFKIKNGFNLQKDNFLFLPNIRLKLSEFSIIFSFKITQIPKDIDNITILNLYNTKNIINVSLDKNNKLIILYNGDKRDKKWNTDIKIKVDKFYFVCISQTKKIIGNPKLSLFINESRNEDKIRDEENKGVEIPDCDSCYYYKQKLNNSIEFSKTIFLELGKTNFIGVVGELLIINKNFTKENIGHLFNLKENYAYILTQIYNKYENICSSESMNEAKLGINKLNKVEERSINFFKQFGYEIKLEIMIYKINRFTKLKYFTHNYYNQEVSNNIIKKKDKEYNESNLSLISMLTIKSSNTSLNSSLTYSSLNNLSNYSFSNCSYIYQKDSYKQEKIDINLNIFKLRYSSVVFYQNKGIDFLTFQLHNIISIIKEQKLLDIYLYEIINFMYKLILIMSEYIIDTSSRKCPKIDNKVSIFFLTLLTLLNKKKENMILNHTIIIKLLEILDYFKFNQFFIQRNIILNILLEVKLYQNKTDIMKYPQLFSKITSDLLDDSNNDISIINNELLYKILMLDDIFELKEYKHKTLMKLISAYLSKYKKNEPSEIDENMINEFINYLLSLKNEIKIYHYLKIIYLDLNKIKNKLKKSGKFLENINMRMEKINYNHCKYCNYNQILCYLLYEEICIKASSENDYSFHYNPNGFMKNPSIFFIKCIFVQCFSFSNEIKFKYIKTKSDSINFILSSINNNNKKEPNTNDLDNKISQIVGFNRFIPRFKAIISYLKYLFDKQKESNDQKLLNIIKESVHFIMDFLKEMCEERKKNLQNFNYHNIKKNWSIIDNDNIINLCDESEKHSKENRILKEYEDFFQELSCCEGIQMFYRLYFILDYEKALEHIKNFVNISIKQTFNPFYFYFFSLDLNFENDLYDNKNENIIQYIKEQLFNLLVTELISQKINYEDSQDIILIKNNILLLIYIYQNVINNKNEISIEFERNIILFLDYLLNNNFINSKYLFDINTILNNDLKDSSNKKFLVEIIVDILFILYDNKNYDLKYHYLIRGLFINNKKNLKIIDEQYFLESRNKSESFKIFNQDYLQSICQGIEVPEILYTIYFLYYLCERLNQYENNNNNNIDNKDNTKPIKLIKEIMTTIFYDAIKIYSANYNKIVDLRKDLIKSYPYKMYKNFSSFFVIKYKDNSFTLDTLIKHYEKLIIKKNINNERNTYFMNEDKLKNNSLMDISTSTSINLNATMKQPHIKNKLHRNLFKIDGNSNSSKKKNSIINILFTKKKSKSLYQHHPFKNFSNKRSRNYSKKKSKTLLKKKSLEDYSDEEKNNSYNNSNEEDQILNIDKEKNNIIHINKNNNNILINEKINIHINNNDMENLSDISDEEENINKVYDIKKHLDSINIPSKIYRYIFHLSDPKTLKILFNPKEYYFWNKFTIILKDNIFKNKKFDLLTKIYKIKYQNLNIEQSYKLKKNKYYLKYPTKVKNFTCEDYYRPFIKPDINFFKHKLLPNSHSYLNKNIFNTNFSDADNLSKIKFKRVIPINYDLKPTKRLTCELINNNGSFYGHIYFNHAFLLYVSDTNNDPRDGKTNIMNEKQEEFYLYSYFLEERIKTKKKYIIMYFCEMKEIFIRRFCLNYIGYEIFMKDNKSYLFNFFNKNNLKKFLQIMSEKIELTYKNNNPNNVPLYSNNDNILSISSLNFNINNEINFNVINDPLNIFEKSNYKYKYQKNEINNFKYLLLLNKYSSRTYNDNSQYLIFPLLYKDLDKKNKRDLSKVICLNKIDEENNIEFYKENFLSNGNHFNTHYSTAGFILYYLVRLIPFTFGQIKLQSGHFDSPERLFSTLNNYLTAIYSSEENRELCPELFFSYESFLNLNHNNMGYIKSEKLLINDLDTKDDYGIIEYIINMRKTLEKSNIIPWINNIFGYNQLNENDNELINIFPLHSYEQKNNFEEKKKILEKEGKSKKEILLSIKGDLCLLGLGITPVQLFKTEHPLRNITSKSLYSFSDKADINNISIISINPDKKVKSLSHKNLINFVNTYMLNKYQIFFISNENNNYGMKLLIKSDKKINAIKLYSNDNNNKNNIIKLGLWKKKQVKIQPFWKICCELSPGLFCLCRYIDNVIQITSEKESFLYQYKCIITSLEFYSHIETKNNANNNMIHIAEVLFGDEEGNLNLLRIEYEYNIKKQSFTINSDKLKIIKELKAHNSFIQGIIYIKRLNIIISYSEEGQITINNAFSFNVINIIELGEKYYIKDIKISDYDLIYIYCFNNINKEEYIKCYTLNGIKQTKLRTNKKINNFFVNEELMVVYENNLIELFNLYNLSGKAIYTINPDPDIKIINKFDKNEIENNIVFCDYIAKDMKLIIIYQDHNIIIQDLFT